MIFKKKNLSVAMLIFLLLCPRNTNSLGFLVALIPYWPYLVPITISIAGYLKISSDKKLARVQDGVDEVNRKVDVVDGKVTVIDGKVTVIGQNIGALQGAVDNFDKKTDQNFIEVKSDVLEAKVILLNELSNKEKVLSDAIKKTEENIKQESHENYENLGKQLEIIKLDIKALATKEDISDLKKTVKLIDDKLNNLKYEIVTNINESELRLELKLKEDFKKQLEDNRDKIGQDMDNKFLVLRQLFERAERKQVECDQGIKNLDNKVTQVINDVGVVKNVIMGKRPVVV